MRNGPVGVKPQSKDYTMGNAAAQMRQWDRAYHLYRGDGLPYNARLAIIHEDLGKGFDIWDLKNDLRIMGLPGARIQQYIVVPDGVSLEISNVELAGSVLVEIGGKINIQNCLISAPMDGAVAIASSHNLLFNLYSTIPSGGPTAGAMITLESTASYNRVIGCDSQGYSGGIVDLGTNNMLVGNV